MEGSKIKIKKTGEITYCYPDRERNKDYKKGDSVLSMYITHYYKSPDRQGEEWERDEFEWVPQYCYELFGIECGDGWLDLLKPILDYVDNYNKDKTDDEKMEIHQIKEKWGELNVYLNFYNDEVKKLIKEAETEASKTCELCGSKEDVGIASEGWITTECHECMKKWCVEHDRPHRWKRLSDNKLYWILPKGEDELFDYKNLP